MRRIFCWSSAAAAAAAVAAVDGMPTAKAAAGRFVALRPCDSEPGRPPALSRAVMGDVRRGADLAEELVLWVSLCLRDFLPERPSW
jgi:hypothetical protein